MPFRHAHWWVMALAPVILLAFWRDYFGGLRGASFAFHAHGLTASAWIALIAAQSWTIHTRRNRWHRALGPAMLVVAPAFAGAAVLVIHSMATKFAGGTHPFYAVFGARLGMHDIVSTVTLVAMAVAAIRHRRTPALHAGYTLATVLLVVPPIMARLPIPVPSYLHFGELVPIAAALAVCVRVPKARMPFAIVAAVLASQIVTFETIGGSAAWGRTFASLSTISPLPWATLAAGAAAAALWSVWPKRPAPRAATA